MRAVVAVGGRFHADKMAAALVAAGHQTTLHTTLPGFRFPKGPSVRAHLMPEIFYRLARWVGRGDWGDERKMQWFGASVARAVRSTSPDLFVSWSSFALETLRERAAPVQVLVRDSSHIQHQSAELRGECQRLGIVFRERPVCEARELEEYALSEHILVLSSYAKRTFVERGIHPSRIQVIPLGVDTTRFQPRKRAQAKLPLKAVFFGTLGPRKGAHYFFEATEAFSPAEVETYAIGAVEGGYERVLKRFRHVKRLPAMSQERLAQTVRKMDVFVFPTIEDGFGQVLIQAMACGLVPIVSESCGAAEAVKDGESGFVVASRDVPAIRDRLSRLVANPDSLIEMRGRAINDVRKFSWAAYDRKITSWLSGCVHKYSEKEVALGG